MLKQRMKKAENTKDAIKANPPFLKSPVYTTRIAESGAWGRNSPERRLPRIFPPAGGHDSNAYTGPDRQV